MAAHTMNEILFSRWHNSSVICFVCVTQRSESLVALATVLNFNKTLKALNISRPMLVSQQEETTDHFARMLKVNSFDFVI